MDKEKLPIFESGFSEKDLDLAADKSANSDQVKSGNIFDPKNKKLKANLRTT
jgi:hypothetical protein